jgi:hypothetical protein
MNEPRGAGAGTVWQRGRRLALFMLIAAAQFLVFEVSLRTWGRSEAVPTFQGLFEDDPELGFRLKPHARTRFTSAEFAADIEINGAGFRDDEELGPKGPDERRILLLGDSIVLSAQVDFSQTFGELLERRLNARATGARYRVINAGVQGYGPVEERLFFRKIVGVVQPDLVLAFVYVGNDAEEAFGSRAKLAPQTGVSSVNQSVVTRLRRLVRRSMVLQILRTRVVAVTGRFTSGWRPPEAPLQTYAANPAPRIAEGLSITRECMQAIAATAAGAGARTALVLVPPRFQIDDADYGRLKAGVAGAGGELVRDAATDRFRAALAPLGLPMHDVLPDFRAALAGGDLFFQLTVHFTPRGHEVMAEVLDRFVQP